MSDRSQEPSEVAGQATGDSATAARDAGSGGRVGGAPADEGEQPAEGGLPREQRAAEGQPAQERAAGTERGAGDTTDRVSAGDTTDRVNAGDSGGRAGDREQRGGTGTEAAGQAGTSVPVEEGRTGEGPTALFADEERDRLGTQWGAVQAAFVDDPRAAVERADALVAEVVRSLTTSFTSERSRLEQQWSQGEDVSTEDLRQALHRYRSFFERLLHV